MECPRCRSVCSDKTVICPRCFTSIPHTSFLKVELMVREGIVLLGFTALWVILFLRNHYIFVRCGIPANLENEILYALGTTIIAYILYWIILIILWGIKALKYKKGKGVIRAG